MSFLLFGIGSAQNKIDLEKQIQKILTAENAKDQYDHLAELMEIDAELSLKQASYYFALYSNLEHINKDRRYPLLADFVMADVLYYNELADSSLHHYLSLASKSTETKEYMLAASGLGNAAYVLSDLGDKIGAINLLKQNLDISRMTGDIRDFSDHTFSIAKYYADLESRDSAIHYFEQTIDIDRKINNKEGMLYNMLILLEQYIAAEKNEDAQELCRECIQVSNEINEKRALAKCYYLSSINFYNSKKFSEAKEHIQLAIDMDNERSDGTRLSKYFAILGDIDFAENNLEEAKEDYRQAIQLAEKFKQQEDIVKSQLALSQVFNSEGQYENALTHIKTADRIVEKNNLNNYRLALYQDYSSLYEQIGNTKEALFYKEKESNLLAARLSERTLLTTSQSRNAFDLYKVENINRALKAEQELAETKIRRRNNLILTSGIIGLLLLGLGYFAFQFQRQRAQQEAKDLKFQVLEKEMTALRSQMNPHFLFNSLSSINDYIMHENPRLASKYLTKFSLLMRTILNNSREKLITLEEEVKASTLYVEMENLRFKEQFQFDLKIDPQVDQKHVLIPSMLIQPYLENAIKHGLRNSEEKGQLSLSIQKSEEQLHIFIEDNGIGRTEAIKLKARKDKNRKSHGMDITTNRVELLNKIHDIDAGVEILDKEDPTGTLVKLTIKYLLKKV